jgi:hypothetical protein
MSTLNITQDVDAITRFAEEHVHSALRVLVASLSP